MGQQMHTQATRRNQYEVQRQINNQSSDNSNLELITITSGQARREVSELSSEFLETSQRSIGTSSIRKQDLEREEKLLEFIGEIIYHCKLHMKKQRKFHYKISALLFYKYFFDKFRQLLTKYWELYQNKEIFRQEYEKKVTLVYQIQDTFMKIKKFVYSKIPFLSQGTKAFLNQDSLEYCFSKKEFFTDLLYPQVQQILKYYHEHTREQFDQHGVNACYIRMIKSIFIIEEIQFHNVVVKLKENQTLPSYDIDEIEKWTDDQIRSQLIQNYKLFLTIQRS